jgi:hypothetical protein
MRFDRVGWALSLSVAMSTANLEPAMAEAAPPSAIPAPALKSGDSWIYQVTYDKGGKGFRSQIEDLSVDRVDSDAMVVGVKADGAPGEPVERVMGRDWSLVRMINGAEVISAKPLSFPLSVGETWAVDYTDPKQYGLQTSAIYHSRYTVVGWEDVETPAGKFRALKIECKGTWQANFAPANGTTAATVASGPNSTIVMQHGVTGAHALSGEILKVSYYAPDLKQFVSEIQDTYDGDGVRVYRESRKLMSYKLAP